MASPRLVFFLFLCCFSAVVLADDIIVNDCNENLTTSSPQMLANIEALLAELASNSDRSRFSTATVGQGDNTVYGLGQCTADKNSTDCSSCIHDAANGILAGCAVNSTDERTWYDRCFLRFSAQNFFGKFDPATVFPFSNIFKPKVNLSLFKKQLGTLMNNISSEAVLPANKGLGKGEIEVSGNVTIYGLVQCTGDLSPQTCSTCLDTGIAKFPKFCNAYRTVGCRVMYSSCYIRYETYQFY